MKTTKGFQNRGQMSSSFQQLAGLIALRAIPHFPHRPVVVQKTKTRIEFSMCFLPVEYTRISTAPLR